jgi:hypothetical protein
MWYSQISDICEIYEGDDPDFVFCSCYGNEALHFENSSVPGYITEKIIDAWVSGTIPIYWGAPDVAEHFNSEAFINCHDFASFDQVIERIDEIEHDDELYMHILSQPILLENSLARSFRTAKIVEYLRYILMQEPGQAKRRPEYGAAGTYSQKMKQNPYY